MCIHVNMLECIYDCMCPYVWCSLPLCSHKHTNCDSMDTNRSRALLRLQAEPRGPGDHAPCCPPGSCQAESCCVPQLSLPPKVELLGSICWMWHMVALTHMYVAMHLYKEQPPTSLTTCTNIHTHMHTPSLNHLEITTNTYTFTHKYSVMHIYSHSHRPETGSLTSWSPVKQITVSTAAHILPAPSTAEATIP